MNIVYLNVTITSKWFEHFSDYESKWLREPFPISKGKKVNNVSPVYKIALLTSLHIHLKDTRAEVERENVCICTMQIHQQQKNIVLCN